MARGPKIFISYRRGAADGITGRIEDHLRREFGRQAVFRDINDIPLGADFHAKLDDEVRRANVFLAVIGPHWLTRGNLKNADDFVRIEIESAIKHRLAIIPVLVQGATMPTRDDLPGALWPLLRRNGMEVDAGVDFRAHLRRLIAGIRAAAGAGVWPPRRARVAVRMAAAAAVAALAAVGSWAAVRVGSRSPSSTSGPPRPPRTEVSRGAGAPSASPVAGMSTEGMVEVAAGPFSMGCNGRVDDACDPDEASVQITLPTFHIDRTEVTVAAYAACVSTGACSAEGLDMPKFDGRVQREWAWACNWSHNERRDHPINCLTWSQARSYCSWLGRRLPTEAEWEKAARGTDARVYPWGNEGFAQTAVANIADRTTKHAMPDMLFTAVGYDDGYHGTSPVGRFAAGASPYGVLDMAGNVWEWAADWYEQDRFRTVRGGSWLSPPRAARASYRYRYEPDSRRHYVGFRCAK